MFWTERDYAGIKRYSPYITLLHHDDSMSKDLSWPRSAHWVEAFLWNATLALGAADPIFPKLSTIYWLRDKNFVSPNDKNIIASRFTDFIGRLVSPRVLMLMIDSAVTPVLSQIVSIIQTLPDLEVLRVPVPFDEDAFELFTCISKLRMLKDFSNKSSSPVVIGSTLHQTTSLFTPGAFHFLERLTVQCHLPGAIALITVAHGPVNVKRLAFRIPDLGSIQQITKLINIVVEKCTNLIAFRMQFNQDLKDVPSRPWGEKIGSNMLRPLFSLGQMTEFEFLCIQDIELSQTFIEAMSIAWPKLMILRLKSFPRENSEQGASLTLDALLPLAKRCPNLRILALSVHPEPGPLADALSSSPSRLPTFKHLKVLTFHLSQYSGHRESHAALLLHRMLRDSHIVTCEIGFRFPFLQPRWEEYLGTVADEPERTRLRRLEVPQIHETRNIMNCFQVLQQAHREMVLELRR